jgi:hypothetical protein
VVKSLILVEGADDIRFIKIFLEFLECDKKYINVKQLNNKSNFFKIETYRDKHILEDLKDENYNKLILIFDADFLDTNVKYGGFINSEREIQNMIIDIRKEIDFDFDIDYHIMCDPLTTDGNLEHLIISTLPTEKQQCVNALLECIKPYKNQGNKKIVLSSYKTIFEEPNYNFSHKNFETLRKKLELLKNN